jgi:hypothetical protein
MSIGARQIFFDCKDLILLYCSSTKGRVQGFDFCIKDDIGVNALSNAAQDG